MTRYSDRDFPPYLFLPGQSPHPEKKGGYLSEQQIFTEGFAIDHYINHPTYLYAIDLFNYGYYWESHVYWEALWHHLNRKGQGADLLKGLIKLAAAAIKTKLNQPFVAKDHLLRAHELFSSVAQPLLGIASLNYYEKIKGDYLKYQSPSKRVYSLALEIVS